MSPVRRGKELPLHNRLQVLRAERGLSRAALAESVEVNPQTIGALERCDHYPSLDLAFRICEVFGLPVEAVFGREPFTPLSTGLPRGGKRRGTGVD
jgi:DNA-binding XRE family transcriptional regulator